MEKFSLLDQVVGKVSEEEKREIFGMHKKRFETNDIPGLNKLEREKTPEEKQILAEVNEATNALRRKFGLEDFNIPEGNMHLIRREEWAGGGESAITLPDMEQVLLRDRDRKIHIGHTAFHEEVHFKSYQADQKLTDCDEIAIYRSGLIIAPRSRKEIEAVPGGYFHDLNEAVTEELTRRYVMGQLANPLYADEFAETLKCREYARKNGMTELLDDDIYSLYEIPGTNEIHAEKFGYKNHRIALYQIRKTIAEKYPDQFKNSDEVLDLFARAMFTGHMFELSHIMEETFGKGTMRAIGTP
jgi:hypothetical protein